MQPSVDRLLYIWFLVIAAIYAFSLIAFKLRRKPLPRGLLPFGLLLGASACGLFRRAMKSEQYFILVPFTILQVGLLVACARLTWPLLKKQWAAGDGRTDISQH